MALAILSRLDAPFGAPHAQDAPIRLDARPLLNHLRLSAMCYRSAARVDLFEACALLSIDGEAAKRTYAETFVACISDALGKRATWFSPGVDDVSFDEAWVLRCIDCIRSGNEDNLNFLLRARVSPAQRRYIGYLLGRISDQFSQI